MNIILKNISKIIIISLGLFLFVNCATNTHTPTKKHKNLSYLYNDSEVFLHPEFQIYNFHKDSSKVFFKVPVKDLLIKDLGSSYDKYGLIEVHYRVYESLSVSSLIDSATFTQRIYIKRDHQQFSFNIKTPNLRKSYLKIQITDVFSERKRHDYLYINKGEGINRQSFLITNNPNKEIVFGNTLLLNTNYHIQSLLLNKHNLFVQEQALIKSIPNIPSSYSRTKTASLKTDTSYICKSNNIRAKESKILFLNCDTSKVKGLALYVNDSTENNLRTPSQLLKPISYLLNYKEYEILLADTNLKYSLDRFWLKIGENPRHASEMIKVYYNRVSVANKYFSSYKEGWMTDRGMIYIIYGEPATIYKSETLERWIYGSLDSEESLSFDFNLIKSTLSENNFELIRKEEYKKSWFQAIDAWRNGRIYSIAK